MRLQEPRSHVQPLRQQRRLFVCTREIPVTNHSQIFAGQEVFWRGTALNQKDEQIEALTNVGKKKANFMCYVMMLRRKCPPTPMGLETKCKNCSNESFGRLSVHLRDGVCG